MSLEPLLLDLRYALRTLRNAPAFATIAILSLALGIGANTAIFSIVDALMLKSLPVTAPEQLVQLGFGSPESRNGPNVFFSYPFWETLRNRQQVFDGLLAFTGAGFDESTGGQRRGLQGLWVGGQFFETLGVKPWIGRLLTPADDRRGGGPDGAVAVLSYPFWVTRYNASPDVLGRAITLNGVPFTIVGVTPPGFFGIEVGGSFNVAVPFGTEPLVRGKDTQLNRPNASWLRLIGRLKPGQTPQQAQTQLQALLPGIREATMPNAYRTPADRAGYLKYPMTVVSATTGTSALRRQYRTALFTITAVVGLVLLIACANLANLLLARATARRKEFAVRLALGASRPRLVRQLLIESLLIAAGGAGFGLLLARWSSQLLVRQLTPATRVTFPVVLDLTLDWRVLVFTIAAAVITALLFGLAPAFRSTDLSAGALMKSTTRSIASGWTRFNLEKGLIAAQIALSLVLVFGAALFVRSFTSLATLDPGFSRTRVLLVDINLRRANVPQEQRLTVYDRLLEAQRATPGVLSIAGAWLTPISGAVADDAIEVAGFEGASEQERAVHMNVVTPGYFETLGIALHAGRDFDAHDTPSSPPVAIVNETFARKFFKGRNALGEHFGQHTRGNDALSIVEIVGVVQDSKYESLREAPPATAYLPLARDTAPGNTIVYAVRTAGDPTAVAPSLSQALSGVNKDITYDFSTLAEQVDDSLIQERMLAMLAGFFGILALLVAGVGLYGVIWLAMTRRRSEIGIRIALGAEPSTVIRMVLREVATLTAIGLAAGAAIAIPTGQLVTRLLFGLTSTDGRTWLIAITLLTTVATVATYLPARHAARIDPMSALRDE
jgi:putative ABC transport system permease protein